MLSQLTEKLGENPDAGWKRLMGLERAHVLPRYYKLKKWDWVQETQARKVMEMVIGTRKGDEPPRYCVLASS